MSQVSFKAEYNSKPVKVVSGWDRPLQYYHLTVFYDGDVVDDDKETVYSCLDEKDPFSNKTAEPLKNKLDELNITVPDGFWELVVQKLGNVFFTFDGKKWTMI